jgi:hypothetical protein
MATERGAYMDEVDRVAQERLELKEWSKATPDPLRQDAAEDRVFPSQDHTNLDELMCEMGLHFLYDWEGVYTPEKRSEVIQMHMDKHAANRIDNVLGVQADTYFICSVIDDLWELWVGRVPISILHSVLAGSPPPEVSMSLTFEQFELCLPYNSLKNKLMRVLNSTNRWGQTYVQTDKLEYRNIATMCDVRNDYQHEEESSDEEYGMGGEERKEMCGKGLEILETIMEKDDQRMGEGEFLELCNMLKEFHKS